MPPLPPYTSWKRFFVERAAVPWVTLAIIGLLVFLGFFLTHVNASPPQKFIIIALSGVAIWQLVWRKNIDMVSLLLAVLGMFILYALQQAEVLSTLLLMIVSGLLAGLLTLWQGHHRFDKTELRRHAYLVGLVTSQVTAFFAYWTAYDDVLAKALLTTVMLYMWWGFIDRASHNDLNWRSARGYIVISVLLFIFVLATMKPIAVVGIHS